MNVVCLDLEGVLVPEIWIEFANACDIPELTRTTREEPDYDKLMQYRLDILDEHGLKLSQIQDTIATLEPFEGARAFLDELRSLTQVMIVSDTFSQFASPLMRKLGWPTILCNELVVDDDGRITGWRMRKAEKKVQVTRHINEMGYETICARRQSQRHLHDRRREGRLPFQDHRRAQGGPSRDSGARDL